MSVIAFTMTAICLGAIVQGRKKPILQVLPMILSFLAWLAFTFMEVSIDNDPSHPDIRVDILFLVPLGAISAFALAMFVIPSENNEDTAPEQFPGKWWHSWTPATPVIVGGVTLHVMHLLLSAALRIPKSMFSETSAKFILYEALPYWALSLSLIRAPRKTSGVDLVAGLISATACYALSSALAVISDLYRVCFYVWTPLLALACCWWAVQLSRRNLEVE
jgi:hypothetical protein